MNNPALSSKQQHYITRINQVLAQTCAELPSSTLSDAMRYSLLAGGKRIRPVLLYATGEMLGVAPETLDPAAAAIEMIHTYSLIHDDLPAMDNDALRRGKPTCHIQFGEDIAILAGDALQTLAFKQLANAVQLSADKRLNMLQELAEASGAAGMCLGQVLDLQAENQQIDYPQLQQIHHYKTGVLIQAAIRLALFAADESAQQYQAQLDTYAQAIGLAFQVQDDILDIIGDQTTMGKPQGSDQQLAKSTYPALLGLANAQQIAAELCQQAQEALTCLPYDSTLLAAIARFIIHRDN